MSNSYINLYLGDMKNDNPWKDLDKPKLSHNVKMNILLGVFSSRIYASIFLPVVCVRICCVCEGVGLGADM